MGSGTRVVWHLPHLAMGRAQRASPTARPSSLPPLFAGAAGGAEGDAGWRALFLHNKTKVIWHHECKVITIYTELQFQVEMRSIC
jgi:hypothetical protein